MRSELVIIDWDTANADAFTALEWPPHNAAVGLRWDAEDDHVRRAMAHIAEDETSHAVLSWDLDECVRSRLSAQERTRLGRAARAALDEMERATSARVSRDLAHLAGVPPPHIARKLVATVRRELFAGST